MSEIESLIDESIDSLQIANNSEIECASFIESECIRNYSENDLTKFLELESTSCTSDEAYGWEKTQIDPYYCPKIDIQSKEIDLSTLDIMALDPSCTSESRVLVLYTGGTIGMKMKQGSYQPESNYLMHALRKLPMFHDSNIKSDVLIKYPNLLILPRTREGRRIIFVIYEYDPIIDSSDITMDDFILVAKDIQSQYDSYEGFVVLHGTDTMAYTASALSFLLENLNKPVIVTGSQIPVFEIRSDGRENLLTSLMLAGMYQIPEVTIFFHEKLLRGNRTSKVSSVHFEAFESPNYSPLASLGVEIIVHSHLIRSSPTGDSKLKVSKNLCPDVSILRMFPSITIQTLNAFLSPPVQGVVLQTYGAGNMSLSRKDILQSLKTASDRGVIIICISQCWRGGVKSLYKTGSILAEYGIISGMDMTPEAALLKLAYVLGKSKWTHEMRMQAMRSNISGEVTLAGPPMQFSKARRSSQEFSINLTKNMRIDKIKVIAAAMCTAAQFGDVVLLSRLGNKYKSWDLINNQGHTALDIAIKYDQTAIVTKILEYCSIETINRLDENHTTPLYNAVLNRCNFQIIDILVQHGAFIDLGDNYTVHNQLLKSVRLNQMDIIRRFHAAKFNFNIHDSNLNSPLHLAVIFNYYDMVQFFVENNVVNIRTLNDLSCTAEDEAYMHNHCEIARILSRSK